MILRAMLRLIGEVAVWTSLIVLLGSGIAATAEAILRRRQPLPRPLLMGMAVGGALLGAGLSDRLGLPEVLVIEVGRRRVPVVWVVAGAILGAVSAWFVHRKGQA